MKQLFVPCPSCGSGGAHVVKYDAPLKILKDRSWLVCNDCNYEVQMDEYKQLLYCA